jgi:hypothetical protein
MSRNPALILGAVLGGLAYGQLIIRGEERFLRQTFGQAFDDYCRSTPRLFPRTLRWPRSGVISVSAKALRLEASRAIRWALAPAALELLEAVQRSGMEW